jgi:hypothetical protein
MAMVQTDGLALSITSGGFSAGLVATGAKGRHHMLFASATGGFR